MMLKLLLVFATITVAWCHDNCPAYPAFDKYHSKEKLYDLLCGTFKVAYTSGTPTACMKVSFENDANKAIIGRVQSPGCCLKVRYNNSASNGLTYDIGPVACSADKCPLLVKRKGSMKVLGKVGSAKSLCLIVATCQLDYYGISVICRGSPPPFRSIKKLLSDLVGDGEPVDEANFQTICQGKCVFPKNNCP